MAIHAEQQSANAKVLDRGLSLLSPGTAAVVVAYVAATVGDDGGVVAVVTVVAVAVSFDYAPLALAARLLQQQLLLPQWPPLLPYYYCESNCNC